MATFNFPPIVPQEFKWENSKKSPGLLQRRANGVETLVGIKESNYTGRSDMYLILSLSIHKNISTVISLSTLESEIQGALLDIRFQRPEIAGTSEWDDPAGPPLIQYKPPKNNEEALSWAQETIHIRTTKQKGPEVFDELERNHSGTPSRSLSIHLIADVADKNVPLTVGTKVDILLYMNHLQWDGLGARIFAGDLLRNINQNFGRDPSQLRYNWGLEIKRLGVPILCDLPTPLDTSSPQFISSRLDYVTNLSNIGQSWGLNPQLEVGRPRMMFHHFSIPESAALIRGVKSRLGPKYTITHLGHAALLLTLLKVNPPPAHAPDSLYFLNPLPLNGRRWLRNKRGRDCYTSCQTGGVMKFENIKSYIVDDNDADAVIQSLKRGSEVAKVSYEEWLSNPFQLAAGISAQNFMAACSTASGTGSVFSEIAGPLFISDGLNDSYVPGDITNVGGEKLISIENVICWANLYQPYMSVRLDSWKGASKVSVYYNDGFFSTEETKTFLEHFVNYMMAFAQPVPESA